MSCRRETFSKLRLRTIMYLLAAGNPVAVLSQSHN